jgi:protein SCO1
MPARLRLTLMVVGSLALVAIVLVIVLARTSASDGQVQPDGWAGAIRPVIPAQDFTLKDQDGRTASLRQYRGQNLILTFLYSTCQDTCPITASTIRGALDDLGHDVPALAVSVDPANDTSESAKKFLLARHVNGRMRFLLGTTAQLTPVWKSYGIAPQRPGKPTTDPAFAHSAYILLIDRRGRQCIGFPVEKATSDGIAHDLRKLQTQACPAGSS